MFSRILIKLIDQSILPAILLLSTRVVSIVLVSKHFNIPFSLGTSGIEYASRSDYVLVNSYSTLIMVLVLASGLFHLLLKSLIFHDTHISPSLTARLFSLKLSTFIQDSFNLYSEGAIWLSYLYLITLASGLLYLFELMYGWVFIFALCLAVVASALLVLDVENEIVIREEDGLISFDGDEYA